MKFTLYPFPGLKPAPNPREEFCKLFDWALSLKQCQVILDGWMPYKIELNARKLPKGIELIELYDRVVNQFEIRPIVHSDDLTPAATFHFSADNYFEDDFIPSPNPPVSPAPSPSPPIP